MKNFLAKLARMDFAAFACTLALVVMGAIFIWSACTARQEASIQKIWISHSFTAAAGLGLYAALACTDYRKLFSAAAVPAYAGAIALLVAVLVFGSKVYGGKRWLWFFQPSEISKLAIIVFLAQTFARAGRTGFKWFAAAAAAVAVPGLLIMAEPDLGTALVLAPTSLAMLLAARVWTRGICAIAAAALLAAGALVGSVYYAETRQDPAERERVEKLIPLRPHQLKRVRVFLFPDRDVKGAGYNLRQAQISIGSGSVWGKGLAKGEQKSLGYLPPSVSMNDFIFAVVAEESGFMGSLLMLALFLGLLLSAVRTAYLSDDDRGRVAAVGIATLVFFHLYVNVAMSIGLMPITGLPLPFISAGRTFLVTLLAALGILQSIHIHRKES